MPKQKPCSVETTIPAGSGVETVRRHLQCGSELLTQPFPGVSTVHELMQRAVKEYANNECMGTRRFIEDKTFDGSRFPLKVFGETQWINYDTMGKRAAAFGRALISLGLKPIPAGTDLEKVAGPHTLLIYEETCASWGTALIGACGQSICCATSYATLGVNAVVEAINECNVSAVLLNAKDVEKVSKVAAQCKSLTTLIYTTNLVATDAPPPQAAGKLKVLSFEEAIELGEKEQTPFTPPAPETTAVIMYTSGSTGKPKGVMITHRNVTAAVAGLKQSLMDNGCEVAQETYLAYLPAAHILELAAEMVMIGTGQRLGYADPKTISSKGACRQKPDGTINRTPGLEYAPGGIQEFRPTVMAAVPKIWDILKKGVEEGVQKKGGAAQKAFNTAYNWPVMVTGTSRAVVQKVIFKAVKQLLGGRLKLGISGGGPISAEVQEFVSTCFQFPLIQGYALTETTCAGTVQNSKLDRRSGIVGGPLGCVEMKLNSCLGPDGNPEVLDREGKPYLSTDKMHYNESCAGRGEVWIRGPSVTKGYFKQPDKTAEVFVEDGWFRSGDVAIWTPDGSIKIVDRLKNLVKLKGGEYIAIEAMEKEYSTSVYANGANGGVMAFGDGDMDRPVAFVQASLIELEKWAKANGVDYASPEALCADPKVEAEVLKSMTEAGKTGGLGANEMLAAVALISGNGSMTEPTATSPWTPENGFLTASNKLNRRPIQTALENANVLGPLKKKGIR